MLEVLKVDQFGCDIGATSISRDISFGLQQGQILAIVGESGCGKSVTFSRMFGLGVYSARRGRVQLCGEDFFAKTDRQQRQFRGRNMGFLFQDPTQAFNPCMTLGAQLIRANIELLGWSKQAALQKAIHLLTECEIQSPRAALSLYPHQLSGGMLQRVMLAMALMHDPAILIADEPTTALDAINTTKILGLISHLCKHREMACILITHDFDVVAAVASHIGVMYAGELVEFGAAATMVSQPYHPYSKALLACRPRGQQLDRSRPLAVIPGQPPSLNQLPSGCAFHPRCSEAMQLCQRRKPLEFGAVKCWLKAGELDDVAF